MLSIHYLSKSAFKLRYSLLGALIFTCCVITAQAQFSSGSTGADGALDLANTAQCPAAQATCTLQLPSNGVFNFTTINIPQGKTLKLSRPASGGNPPAILLASGNVVINGIIDVSGSTGNSTTETGSRAGGLGGPGGFDGGGGGFRIAPYFNGSAGDGPGGGGGGGLPDSTSCGASCGGGQGGYSTKYIQTVDGQTYGSKTIVPFIGGSGGGGGQGNVSNRGCGGGGGGGAILIASSTSIVFSNTSGNTAQILARGGSGFSGNCSHTGGTGSGGAIRLISNSLSGYVFLNVNGFSGQYGAGRIRIETSNSTNFAPDILPNNVPEAISFAQPNPVFQSTIPRLIITSVGGQNITSPSNSPHGTPDLTLPQTLPNPVVVNVASENVPPGTIVKLNVIPQYGVINVTKGAPLAGTLANSTASQTVNLPNGLSYIIAVCEFDVSMMAGKQPLFINGEQVQKVEVSANVNGKSEVIYITKSGKRIKAGE